MLLFYGLTVIKLIYLQLHDVNLSKH